MASAVMIKLSELGFDMPGEIAVTGMDGTDEANGYITTARYSPTKPARRPPISWLIFFSEARSLQSSA